SVSETEVMVPTPDGSADAALFHPAGAGSWPAVLMWPDILGLRPVFREMGRRLAAEGYTVLVPNPFYRTRRAPIVTGPVDFNEPNSPHLLIPKTKASFVVAIAQNDDHNQPEAKDVLRAAFAAAKRPAVVEVYPADHGWCVPGSQTYNQAAAERAWSELLHLYR